MTDCTPKTPVEAAVDTSDYLYEEPEQVDATIKVITYDSDQSIELPVVLYDTHLEKKLKEIAIKLELHKNEVVKTI